MPTPVIMPALGPAQETGKVVRWLRAEGDRVARGEPLLEIETDKVTVELESPADGTLASITASAAAEVPVGTAIAVVLADGEEVIAAAAPHRRLASPKARRLAREHGVHLDRLTGSGPNGAIVAADVEAQVPTGPVAALERASGSVWRVMAERTQRAWQEVPHFSLTRHVDASRLESWRAVARERPGCERVSHTDLLVRVCAEALRRHRRVNAMWTSAGIETGEEIGVGVGVAVAIDDGVVVPVIRRADALDLAAITARRLELAEAARAGRLRPDDLAGGTFTISNLGMYGVDAFQAIVNAPQAAILAVGRIRERPMAVAGEVAIRPMLTLTASFDHRVVDGARGAAFLETIATLIEEPAGLVP